MRAGTELERPRFAPASPRVQKDDSGGLRPDPRFYSASAMGSVGRDGRGRAPLLFYLFKTAVWGRRRSDVARTSPVRSFLPAALPERKDGARGVPGAPRVKAATLAVQTGSPRGAPENRAGKELQTGQGKEGNLWKSQEVGGNLWKSQES